MSMDVHKVTLSSGKVVLLKDPEVGHVDMAVDSAASRGGENKFAFSNRMQKELLKILVVKIDDHMLTPIDKEQIGKLLNIREYTQLMQYVATLTGDADMGKPQSEVLSSGDK